MDPNFGKCPDANPEQLRALEISYPHIRCKSLIKDSLLSDWNQLVGSLNHGNCAYKSILKGLNALK